MTKDAATTQEAFSALSDQVLALPDEKFLQALQVLTQITDEPGTLNLFDKARDRLRALRPYRPPQLKRQLCIPFETLLHSGEPGRPGRIARQTIEPVWSFLTTHSPKELDALQARIRALSASDEKIVFDVSARLWDVAARLLDRPWPGAPTDMPLMRRALASAVSIEATKDALGLGIVSHFSDEAIELINKTMVRLRKAQTQADAYLLVVASRLDNPVRLFTVVDKKTLPVALTTQIESLAVDAVVARNRWFCENADALDVEQLTREADRLVTDMRITRNGVSRQRTAEFDQNFADSTAKLRETLQKSVISGAAPIVTAALTEDLPTTDMAEAERRARALHRAKNAATELGLADGLDKCMMEIRAGIDTQISSSMNRLARPDARLAGVETAEADFFRAIRVLELIEGSNATLPLLNRMLSLGQGPN